MVYIVLLLSFNKEYAARLLHTPYIYYLRDAVLPVVRIPPEREPPETLPERFVVLLFTVPRDVLLRLSYVVGRKLSLRPALFEVL